MKCFLHTSDAFKNQYHSETILKMLISAFEANITVSPNCNFFCFYYTAVQHHHKTSSQKNHFISCHARKLNINILIGMRVIKGVYQLSRLCRHLVTLHHFNAVMHEYKKIFINIFIVEIVKHNGSSCQQKITSIKLNTEKRHRGVIDGNRLCQIPQHSIIRRLLYLLCMKWSINSGIYFCLTAFGC